MVAKITSGVSVYGALYYNQEKVDKGKARTLAWNRIMERPDGTAGIPECMRSFEAYLAANRRTEKPVIHLSLNPHPDDKLSDEQLEAIGREYMEKLGYGDQPYIIFRHEDNARPHIHIVSLRIDEQGRKIRDYKEWERSMKICRELEQEYGLLPSRKEEYKVSSTMSGVDSAKGDLKRQIAGVVKPALLDYRFRSLKEFKALLGLFNVTVEEVHKNACGRICHGLVYAALDGKGRRCGVGIKSSDIGRSVGYEALKKKCARSRAWMKKHPVPARTKEAIREALWQDTRQGFLRLLAGRGIVPILWENEKGVIYGVTYIDHDSKTVFKGSALGREFSASVLNGLYGVSSTVVSHEDTTLKKKTARGENGLIEGLLDILSTESRPYPEEETARGIYGKKKKKRKRCGPHIG